MDMWLICICTSVSSLVAKRAKHDFTAVILGDAMMDGSQAGFSSSVDNVFQQSLNSDSQQIGDWQVCSLHHTALFT